MEKKNITILTVDVEFSTHKGTMGIFGNINGKEYGLPKILKILSGHNVKATFFVDVYGYLKYGESMMKDICLSIFNEGHDVELHTHPENFNKKKIYMWEYNLTQQEEIIKQGKHLIEKWLGVSPVAHRAGDWAANLDTILALRKNNIFVDSSAFKGWQTCKLNHSKLNMPYTIEVVLQISPTIFVLPFFNRYEILDLNYMSLPELKYILGQGFLNNINPSVLVMHSFSFLRWDKQRRNYTADYNTIKKFEGLLEYAKKNATVLTMRDFYYKRISLSLQNEYIPRDSYYFLIQHMLKKAKNILRR